MIVEEKMAREYDCCRDRKMPCSGPMCMAWRWDVEDKHVPGGGVIRQRSNTHGYCGLAGRP